MPANLLSGNHQKKCIEGSKFLFSLDQDWNLLVSSVGPCKLNLSIELEPYQALIKSVIFQQLRPASATAIFNRFKQNFDNNFPTAEKILAAHENKFKDSGLSLNKRKTIIEIARLVKKGELENRQGFLIIALRLFKESQLSLNLFSGEAKIFSAVGKLLSKFCLNLLKIAVAEAGRNC